MLRREPWNMLLWSLDRLLPHFLVPTNQEAVPMPVRRILVCNNGHLGDLVNATAILAPLRKLFPTAQIGFLTSSCSVQVIKSNPEVSYVHTFDHFLLNRSDLTLPRKIKEHISTARRAVRQLREVRYEVGIDTYHFIQNSIPVLWMARIPVRIGYSSGGFGPLLTHAHPWVARDRHLVDYHLDLLRPLGLNCEFREVARPIVAWHRNAEVAALPRDYVVLHPASGASFREWPVENWALLARKLEGAGWKTILTGSGVREQKNVEVIRSTCPATIDLCGRLSWDQFVYVLESARLLVGVESSAGHTAAAVSTPCVVIYSGATNMWQMRPFGAAVVRLAMRCPARPASAQGAAKGWNVFEKCLLTEYLKPVLSRYGPEACRKE